MRRQGVQMLLQSQSKGNPPLHGSYPCSCNLDTGLYGRRVSSLPQETVQNHSSLRFAGVTGVWNTERTKLLAGQHWLLRLQKCHSGDLKTLDCINNAVISEDWVHIALSMMH
jgi:hypothetical protein